MSPLNEQDDMTSEADAESIRKWIPIEERKPSPNRMVYYLTEDYEGVGYVNAKGLWLSAPNRFENNPVHFWREIQE